MLKNFLFAMLALVFAGCVSYSYKGSSEPRIREEKNIRVFTSAAQITRRYKVLGKATVAGNCQDVSRDRLIAKLRSKASENGADAVLVTDQQMITLNEDSGSSPFFTAFDADDTNQNWSQLKQDVDANFTNTRRSKNTNSPGASRRIIEAEFIRYTK